MGSTIVRVSICMGKCIRIQRVNLQDSSCMHASTSRVENGVEPDQLASKKAADLDLNYFQNMI